MPDSSSFSERERADLVAYLDGELGPEAVRKIDSRLACDPAARDEIEGLRKAWEMLDFLPQPEPSAHFSHRTVERLSVTARTRARARGKPTLTSALVATGWAAAIIFAIALGYGGSRSARPKEPGDQELVRDLRVIENKRLYDAADDLDLVRELDVPELFGDDAVGT
jgi:anti-sigma factor RsiW